MSWGVRARRVVALIVALLVVLVAVSRLNDKKVRLALHAGGLAKPLPVNTAALARSAAAAGVPGEPARLPAVANQPVAAPTAVRAALGANAGSTPSSAGASHASASRQAQRPPAVAQPVLAPRSTDQLLFDGQSLNRSPETGRTYPDFLMSKLWDHVQRGPVVAVNGSSYAQRSQDAWSRVDTHFRDATRSLVLDLAGQTELYSDIKAPDILRAAEAYADARRAAGARFIAIFTVPPSTKYTRTEEIQRVAYNDLLRQDVHHKFDAVIDIASRPELSNPSDGRYYYDGIHPTQEGARVIADTAEPVVRRLLGY